MRAYKIIAKDGSTVIGFQVAGTNADARTTKKDLAATKDVRLKDVSVEDLEIPVAKSELLGFINRTIQEAYDLGFAQGQEQGK